MTAVDVKLEKRMVMVIQTNYNVNLTVVDDVIMCSNGNTYRFMGMILTGPGVNCSVKSMDEAISVIAGLYGGRRFGG